MATNVFHDPTTKIPERTQNISVIDMSKSDEGARKSHLPKPQDVRNDKSIQHVK